MDDRSEKNLVGVHPDLVRVVRTAYRLADGNFTVTEGLRTKKRQAELLKAGATQIMDSRHLTGHAVDLMALVNGKGRWDWPLYAKLAGFMKQAAALEHVDVEWGGDWKKFKDGPHFQLSKATYP